jgi:hypothetical protein
METREQTPAPVHILNAVASGQLELLDRRVAAIHSAVGQLRSDWNHRENTATLVRGAELCIRRANHFLQEAHYLYRLITERLGDESPFA